MGVAVAGLIRGELYDAFGHEDTVVYHYTTTRSLHAILESRSLWLTDLAYLNDASEVSHGVTLGRQIVKEMVGPSDETAEWFEEVFDEVDRVPPRTSVACFSLVADSLSQWRAYSRGTCGVAVAFRPTDLMHCLGLASPVTFSRVLYDRTQKEHLFKRYVHYTRLAWREDVKRDNVLPQWRSACSSLAAAKLYSLAAVCKDDSFADEREYRIICQESSNTRDLLPRRFRVDDPVVVPYVSTRDIQDSAEASEEHRAAFRPVGVIVGPHPRSELVAAGIREYLLSLKFEDVPVEVSKVPFR